MGKNSLEVSFHLAMSSKKASPSTCIEITKSGRLPHMSNGSINFMSAAEKRLQRQVPEPNDRTKDRVKITNGTANKQHNKHRKKSVSERWGVLNFDGSRPDHLSLIGHKMFNSSAASRASSEVLFAPMGYSPSGEGKEKSVANTNKRRGKN